MVVTLLFGVPACVARSSTGGQPNSAAAPETINDWSHDEFQFAFELTNPVTPPGRKSSSRSTVYVYVPAEAKQVRALLLLQQNVVEQMISVHPAIRRVCDANAVAIAWCSPGFDLVFKERPAELHALVQDQFRRFGHSIGYPELGDVPLIAFGHSNTCAYAQNGAEARPDRVLAVLATHGWNGVNALHRYRGPVLVYVGTFWEQKQQTLGNSANKPVASLAEVQRRLRAGPMPISILEEYGSGHFDYSEPVVEFFARYIERAIQRRLAADGSLREVDLTTGWIAAVPEFPHGPITVRRYADATAAERASSPWYFDRELAETAARIIAGDGPWNRATQLIGFRRPDGARAPFSKAGPVSPLPYRIVPGTNEFQIFPELLRVFPADFKEAGQPIAPSSRPEFSLQYDCGPYVFRDGDGKYRLKLNRNGFGGYLVVSTPGDAKVRPAVQGTRFVLAGTGPVTLGQVEPDGAAQRWPVGPAPLRHPGDQKCGARVALPPGNSPTEYLGYYVDYGPARVVGQELQILPLPANTRGPVEVKLTAYRLTQTIAGLSSVTFRVSR
ncbi:hypothetical protein DB354_12865 [Opitutus sp. ER46]|nr:hypothetical protein DB354_12865 [Opitutus sp. ER46]